MTWVLFAALTVILWGTSETIFKSVSNNEKDSVLKLISYNGLVLGICSLIYMLITKTEMSFDMILTYLPVSIIFVTSMFCTYAAMRYVKVSITSPIQNSACALSSILCILILGQEVNVIHAIAIVAIIIGLILISINKDENNRENEEKQTKSRKVFLIGIGFALMYWLLDGFGSFMDENLLEETLTADQLFISYGLIYMSIAILAGIALQIIKYIKKQKGTYEEEIVPSKIFRAKKLIGALVETSGQFTYTYAYFFGEGSVVAPFIAAYCIVTMLFSRIFLKEKLSVRQYILIGIILASLITLSVEI